MVLFCFLRKLAKEKGTRVALSLKLHADNNIQSYDSLFTLGLFLHVGG